MNLRGRPALLVQKVGSLIVLATRGVGTDVPDWKVGDPEPRGALLSTRVMERHQSILQTVSASAINAVGGRLSEQSVPQLWPGICQSRFPAL